MEPFNLPQGFISLPRGGNQCADQLHVAAHCFVQQVQFLVREPDGCDFLLAGGKQAAETPIWLTHQEWHLLDEAMSGYVQLVRALVPASRQRDETLREIEGFRDTLSGFQATPVMLK